jgi:hypothetical protein
MTPAQGPTPDDPLDRLVRAHLERIAESVDGAEMLRKVRSKQAQATIVPPSRRQWATVRRWSWSLAATAAVVLVFFLGVRPGQVSAETLLREAQQVHALPVDRCYRVTVAADPALLAKFPWLTPQRETRLWTRGDQFWIESLQAGRKWAWGRDAQGRVWFALLPRLGLRFSRQDVPEPLAHACDVRSVRLETLLADVLRDFEIHWGEPEGRQQTIVATPRSDHAGSTLHRATLQIDPHTRVVERLVLERQLGGQPLVTVTWQLVETGVQPAEGSYYLEGHLETGSTILGRERMGPGKQLLKLLFGDVAEKLP